MPVVTRARARQTSVSSNLCAQKNPSSFDKFRLPAEILRVIFTHCTHDYPHSTLIPTSHVPDWVNVSYVCRHWRDVALNCPTLWSYVFTVSLRWTKELLARSKQASLKIRVDPEHSHDDLWWLKFVEEVMNHAERIQELYLHIPETYTYINPLYSYLSPCAPRLQNLQISLRFNNPDPAPDSDWSPVLFHGDTPALRTLELSECAVPWYLFKLDSLTTLHLRFVPAEFGQDMVGFLAALSRMQNLTHLHLEDVFCGARKFLSSDAFSAPPTINLPRLSRLLVSASITAVVALLSCVNVPSKTMIRVECHSDIDYIFHDYALLSPLLAQRFQFSMTGDYADHVLVTSSLIRRTLVIQFIKRGWPTLSISECDSDSFDSLLPLDWDCNVHFKMVVYLSRFEGSIISTICGSLPSSNVTFHRVSFGFGENCPMQ